MKFIRYWKAHLETTKDAFDYIMWAGAILCGGVAVISWLGHYANPIGEWLREMGEKGAVIFFVVWCFVWVPFRRHDSLVKANQEKLDKQSAEFNEKVKAFENEIQALKTELNSNTLQRRAQVIEAIHAKLIHLLAAVEEVTLQKNPDSDRKLYVAKYWELAIELHTYFEVNKLYIPDEVAARIQDYREFLQASLIQFTQAKEIAKAGQSPQDGTLYQLHWDTTRQAEIKWKVLVEDFKAILGLTKPVSETTKKAVAALYDKLLPLLNSWENCTELMEDDADKLLQERQAKFQIIVNDFNEEYEREKLLMTAELAKEFQTLANKTIDFFRKSARAMLFQKSKPMDMKMMDTHYNKIQEIETEIPQLRRALEARIRTILN